MLSLHSHIPAALLNTPESASESVGVRDDKLETIPFEMEAY